MEIKEAQISMREFSFHFFKSLVDIILCFNKFVKTFDARTDTFSN